MPVNIFLADPSDLRRWIFPKHDDDGTSDFESDSNAGLGLQLALGKEWMVTDNIGLSVALSAGSSGDLGRGSRRISITTT